MLNIHPIMSLVSIPGARIIPIKIQIIKKTPKPNFTPKSIYSDEYSEKNPRSVSKVTEVQRKVGRV